MKYSLREKEVVKASHQPIESMITIPSKQGTQIALTSRDSKAYLVNLSSDLANFSSKVVKAYDNQHRKLVTDIEYSPEGDKLITVSADQKIVIWEKETKAATKFSGHDNTITCVAINPSCNKIVTGSQDKSFALWNTLGQKIAVFDQSVEHAHKSWVNDLGFVPNSNDILVTASEDGTVKIWDLENNCLLKTFFDGTLVDYAKAKENRTSVVDFNFEYAVKSIAFSKDGSLLAYGGRNGKVYILDLNESESLISFGVQGPVFSLAFAENKPLLLVSIPSKILVWDIFNAEVIVDYSVPDEKEVYIRSVTFIGDEIVAAMEDGTIIRFDMTKNN